MGIPYHVAIIIDGNGRWANKRKLPRTAGHRQGIKRIKEVAREAQKIGIKALTIFAFSTENWNRPKEEIEFLFSYLDDFLDNYKKELMKDGIRLKIIGRRDRINKRIIKKIESLEKLTSENNKFFFNIALDYGGRWDIVNSAKNIACDYKNGKIAKEDIDENMFNNYLELADVPDPDLLVRTSGEQRISNFLLWNLAYSEVYFTPVFWPDFGKDNLHEAAEVYEMRKRRFGEIRG